MAADGDPGHDGGAAADPGSGRPMPDAHFRVHVDDREVAVASVSAPHWLVSLADHDPDVRQAVVLRRAIDGDRVLYDWRRSCEVDDDVRTIRLTVLAGPDGPVAQQWQLTGCRPVRWSGPRLDTSSDDAALEELEVRYDAIAWL